MASSRARAAAWAARWRAARRAHVADRGGERVAGLLELGQVEQARAAVRDPPVGHDPRVGRGQRVGEFALQPGDLPAQVAAGGGFGRARGATASTLSSVLHGRGNRILDGCRATTPRTPAGSSSGAARERGRCTIAARRSAAAPGAGGPTACSRRSCSRSRCCCACRSGARSRSRGCGSARRPTTRPARTSSASSVAFVGILASLFVTLALCSRLDRLWRLLRRAAGHEQRDGVLPRIFGATAVIALVLFASGSWCSRVRRRRSRRADAAVPELLPPVRRALPGRGLARAARAPRRGAPAPSRPAAAARPVRRRVASAAAPGGRQRRDVRAAAGGQRVPGRRPAAGRDRGVARHRPGAGGRRPRRGRAAARGAARARRATRSPSPGPAGARCRGS